MKRIAIVDICGTLFKSNTTFDFIDFVEIENLRYRIFLRIIKSLPIRALNHLIYIIFKIDVSRILRIKFLKGKSRDLLNQLSIEFYEKYLSSKINSEVINKLNKLDSEIILASATLYPIAKIILEKIHAKKCFASELKYDKNGVCKGKLVNDLLGVKFEELVRQGYVAPFTYVVSNDFTDMPLFINSENRIIIATKKNYSKWERMISKFSLNNSDIICIG